MDTGTNADTDTPTDTGMSTDTALVIDTSYNSDTGSGSIMDTGTGNDPILLASECDDVYGDALVCTGFEDGITLPVWGSDTLEATETLSFSGLASMYATTSRPSGGMAHVVGSFSPLYSGELHFRAYFYIPEGTLVGRVKVMGVRGYDTGSNTPEMAADINVEVGGILDVYFHSSDTRYRSSPGAVQEGG